MFKKIIHFLRLYLLESLFFLITVSFLFIQHLEIVFNLFILLSYFFLITLLNSPGLIKAGKKSLNGIKNKPYYSIFIFIFLILFLIWHISFASIILAIFALFALYGWNSRVVAVGGLILFILSILFLVTKQIAYAETAAVYAYFFLIMTITLQILEYKRHTDRFVLEDKERNI